MSYYLRYMLHYMHSSCPINITCQSCPQSASYQQSHFQLQRHSGPSRRSHWTGPTSPCKWLSAFCFWDSKIDPIFCELSYRWSFAQISKNVTVFNLKWENHNEFGERLKDQSHHWPWLVIKLWLTDKLRDSKSPNGHLFESLEKWKVRNVLAHQTLLFWFWFQWRCKPS